MARRVILLNGKPAGFICGRAGKPKAPRCQYGGCTAAGIRLCDYVTVHGHTCNKNMCLEHRAAVAPGGLDYCWVHGDLVRLL